MGQHVARRPGHRRDDGPPRAGQPVEQRGLADIRAADEHDRGQALGARHVALSYRSQGLVVAQRLLQAADPLRPITPLQRQRHLRFDSVSDTK